MKTKLLISFLLLAITFSAATGQVQKAFNYQAIARDATSGNPLANTSLQVRFTITSDSLTDGTIFHIETYPSVTTNSFGLINVLLGKGIRQTGGTAANFASIDWSVSPKYVKTEIYYGGGWKNMGKSRLWSVPYALVADKANGVNSGNKLTITSPTTATVEDALFEVKNKSGQTVFAVYPEGVRAFVGDGNKGTKGGFAVGGFGAEKADPSYRKYFYADGDSVRIYIDPTPGVKGSKGGFAVGGYGETAKGINDMYFNLTKATSVNTVLNARPQILWYPQKNAFLAGNIRIFHIDSVGDYSTALGYQSRAAGDYSQAFGYKAIAAGDYSTSIGKRSVAGQYNLKHNAFALGNATQALGDDSYAFGSGAKATGDKSFAFGSVQIDSSGHALSLPTTASGLFSTAIGMGAQATNTGSLAFGNSAISSGYASLALGFYSTVTSLANYGSAIGYLATANNYSTVAMGLKANAQGSGSMAIGPYSTTGTNATYAGSFGYSADALGPYSVAIGFNAQTPYTAGIYGSGAFGYYASASGAYSVAVGASALTGSAAQYAGSFGYNAKTYASNSVAIGYNSQVTATGTSAGAFGLSATANGPYSISIGASSTTGSTANYAGSFGYSADALAPNSVAVGYNAQVPATGTSAGSFGNSASAAGPTSVAVGNGATTGSTATNAGAFGYLAAANGANSVAVGNSAVTGGQDASAFGKGATANGTTSMALGTNAVASGSNSVSIGYSSDATNSYSVAMGYDAQSTGQYSMALGYSSIASNTSATSLGYNTEASGLYSTALGYNSIASGEKSMALGSTYTYTYLRCRFDKLLGRMICTTYNGSVANIARRAFSAAIGNGNTAEDGGMALGFRNQALSSGAIAIGYLSTADTTQGFAAGTEAVSHGLNAMAIGQNVTAEAASSTVMGSYNVTNTGYNRYEWIETDPLFVIGNGDETSGHDALRILKNGQASFYPENATYGLYLSTSNPAKTGTSTGLYVSHSNSTTTNTSSVYGGRIYASNSGTGYTYGTISSASNTSSNTSPVYGTLSSATQNGNDYAYSGYFQSFNYGTSTNYGLYSEAYNSGSSAYYSGRFVKYSGSPGTNYYGLYADTRSGAAIDLAEYIYDTEGNTAAADVVVADPNKKESVIKSSKPYQTSVVGVVSTKPHLIMGMELITDEKTGAQLPGVKATRLALSGRVPVNVCGENGAIKPGDYLTTSSTPGYAMKWTLLDVSTAKDFEEMKKILAENEKRRGAIIGKAVDSFSGSGTGKIVVLISLQ